MHQLESNLTTYLPTLSDTSISEKERWRYYLSEIYPKFPDFESAQFVYKLIYPQYQKKPGPIFYPNNNDFKSANLTKVMDQLGLHQYKELHHFSVTQKKQFWQTTLTQLNIQFQKTYEDIVNLEQGNEFPKWLPGAQLNIVASCFQHDPNEIAVISQSETGHAHKMTYGKLDHLSSQIAGSLQKMGFVPGDVIGIALPMHAYSVAIYLGIIKAGCIVCAIAESFVSNEIATRLNITHAKAVFTQDVFVRNHKELPLYSKVVAAHSQMNIVFSYRPHSERDALQANDLYFDDFLQASDNFHSVYANPEDPITYLFSSGTTGEPKAIPWNHTTPIKCGSDAFYHLNLQKGDRLSWPTSFGWMMGPFVVFAALINGATIALFEGSPSIPQFAEFLESHQVTHLGVVPSLVKTWRSSKLLENISLKHLKVFSSTAECSNIEDMFYLSWLAGFKPIIEYCGGTEIGGAYISGTVVEPCAPSTFTTPTLGLDFVLLDDTSQPSYIGEVALIPPSFGLSLTLLNRNHHAVYFADMPSINGYPLLRRHGDEIEKVDEQFFRALGRMDDTMKLSGIKISSAEIERTLDALNITQETAAIAIPPPGGGPMLLIIYAVAHQETPEKEKLFQAMQTAIKTQLNPLFKIHDVVLIEQMPRTASNKVMRRVLRDMYKV